MLLKMLSTCILMLHYSRTGKEDRDNLGNGMLPFKHVIKALMKNLCKFHNN